jgi:hypothetical protein
MKEHPALAAAQAQQMGNIQSVLNRLQAEREQLLRLTILLANAIKRGAEDVPMVQGHVAVKVDEYNRVPRAFRLDVKPAQVREDREPTEDEEEVPVENVLVLVVSPVEGQNGKVAVPTKPRILLP